MLQGFKPFLSIGLLLILIVLPVIGQGASSTVEPDLTATPSSSPTASMTPIATATIAEISPEVTLEVSPTASPTAAEVTVEVSEEAITPTSTESQSPETTEAAEITETVIQPSETATSTISPTATIGGLPMQMIRGSVQYQSRREHSGISVKVLTVDELLFSVAETNADGIFSIAAPAEVEYILLIEAPLYRNIRLQVEPDINLPPFLMAGGDLNSDGCINGADMDRLLLSYDMVNSPESDINADGVSNLSDLAILTGNFSSSCGIVAESTAESTQEAE